MELANLKLVRDEQLTSSRLEVAIAALAHRPINTKAEAPKLIRGHNGRRLDVDGILARSLPKVAGTPGRK